MNRLFRIWVALIAVVLAGLISPVLAQTPPRSLEILSTWMSRLGIVHTASGLTADEPDNSTPVLLNKTFVRDSAAPSSRGVLFCEPEGMNQAVLRFGAIFQVWHL